MEDREFPTFLPTRKDIGGRPMRVTIHYSVEEEGGAPVPFDVEIQDERGNTLSLSPKEQMLADEKAKEHSLAEYSGKIDWTYDRLKDKGVASKAKKWIIDASE